MAVPTSFAESNAFLDAPKGMDDLVQPLSAAIVKDETGVPQFISCWKFTQEELDEVKRTKRIWLGVVGEVHPPVWVMGTKPRFR